MSETVLPVRGAAPYDVVVGHDLAGHLPAMLGEAVQRVAFLYDGTLGELAQPIVDSLVDCYDVLALGLPPGEGGKNAGVVTDLWEALGAAGFTRSDVVVTFGGGATTDLGGFVAATWLRGVRVIHLPTTLLGMVDAAVGGKTGINTAEGKNLVGAFHSPRAVLCDLDTLATLPPEDHVAGLAEVVKCGFIADPRILELVEADGGAAARDHRSPVLAELVRRAVEVKADVVSADLREQGRREFLNYGHTLAHAIELGEDFRWRHGDAVAVGMVFAAELARAAGRLSADDVARHRRVLLALGLPTTYRQDRWPQLLEAMGRDKKTRGSMLRFVLLDGVGSPGRLEGPDPALLEQAYAALAP